MERHFPTQAADADQAGWDQEQIGAHPGGGRGEAGGRVSKHGYQEKGHARPGDHLQHTGQNGKSAVSHPLDGKPDDVDQGEGNEEGAADHNVLAGESHQPLHLRLARVQEQHGAGLGKEQHPSKGQRRVQHSQQRTGPDPLPQAFQLPGPHVLAAVGGHGGPHGVKGTAQQLKELAPSGHRRHIGAAQTVHRRLEHDGADGGDGVLHPHGNSYDAQGPAGGPVQPPLLSAHTEHRVLLCHEDEAGRAGDALRYHRGDGRPRHTGVKPQDEGEIQRDVQHGRESQKIYRGPAVPQGAQDPRQQIVEKRGGDPQEDNKDIALGVRKNILRGVHHRENGAAQKAGGHREHQGEQDGEVGRVCHMPAHADVVAGPHPLGHRDSKPAAHPHAEADDKKVDGAGRAHRRQSLGPQQLPHDHRVHQIIELLKQHAQQRGQAKAQNQPHGAARRQILGHVSIPLFFTRRQTSAHNTALL